MTRILYTEDHETFRDAVADFALSRVGPRLTEIDLDGPGGGLALEAMFHSLRGNGIIDEVPRTESGTLDWIALGILVEGMATADASLGFLTFEALALPEVMGALMSPEQQKTFAHLLDGTSRMGGAYSEADAGSNPGEIVTSARRVADGWLINGAKMWVSGAHRSDALVVSCRIKGDADDEGAIAPFLVERAVAPYTTKEIDLFGLRAHSVAEVHFDELVVPADARLGVGQNGLALVAQTLHAGRCTMATIAVGIAQHALDLALAYAKERQQFGRPIASFQLVQEMLVQMSTDTAIGRLLAFRALTIVQEGGDATVATSTAKLVCTEAAQRVASLGIQVHGGIGLTTECVAQRLFRDARMMTIPDGTSQIQQLILGRKLTGLSALR
jgi:alkylation response protein AidB-like acyl-CoA dehydrogenase